MKRYYLLLVLSIILSGCGERFSDPGGGYKIRYGPGGPFVEIVNSQNTVIITEHILDYIFDTNFIVVAQRPFDSVPVCNDGVSTYQVCKEAILYKSTFRQYWIINKQETGEFDYKTKTYSNVYGPFKEEQLTRVYSEFEIPDKIRLYAN
jgi:hypothetical protein